MMTLDKLNKHLKYFKYSRHFKYFKYFNYSRHFLLKAFLHFLLISLLTISFFYAHSQVEPYCGDEINNLNKPFTGSRNSNLTAVSNSRVASTYFYPPFCDSLSLFNFYPYDSTTLTKNHYLHFIIRTDTNGIPIGGITKADIDFLMLNTNAILNPHKFYYCYYDISYSSLPYEVVSVPLDELVQYVFIDDLGGVAAGVSGNPILLDYAYVRDSASDQGRILAHELAHNYNLKHDSDPANLMYPSSSGGKLLTERQIATIHCTENYLYYNYYMFEGANNPYYVKRLDFSNKVCNNFGTPYALFYANNYGGCVPLQVPFIDYTFFEPTKWLWDFGDDSFDTTANPVHTYTKAGIYNVTLVVSNSYGSDTLTKNNYITATDSVYSLPVYEDFEDTSGSWFTPSKDWYIANPDYLYMFFAKYSNSVPAQTGTTCIRVIDLYLSYNVPPTDGNVNSLITPPVDLRYVKNPYITFNLAYPTDNIYFSLDTLFIHAGTNCGASFEEIYKKYNNDHVLKKCRDTSYPNYDILCKGTINGHPVELEDTAKVLSTILVPDSLDGNSFYPYVSEAWRKDSVNLSYLEGKDSVVFKFTFHSQHSRYLYLDDILITAEKISGLPVADFTADTTTIYKNDTIHFTNLSNKYSDTLQWLFTGATITTSNDTNPSIIYDSVGIFPVTLVVWNMFGRDTLTKLAYINVLQKIIDTIPCDSMKIIVSKNDLSCKDKNDGTVTASAFNGNSNYSYSWSNGSTLKMITGLAEGTYTVTVTDSIGCTKTDSVKINYTDSLPAAGFSYTDTGNTVNFTNLSINTDSSLWNFGDDSTDNSPNPNHIYFDFGIYEACLIAMNNCGADTMCKSISIIEGIKESTSKINLQIFPNPNSGTFTIIVEQSKASEISITLTNILGQKIYTNKSAAKVFKDELNLTNFSKGLYSLKVVTNNESVNRKVVYR